MTRRWDTGTAADYDPDPDARFVITRIAPDWQRSIQEQMGVDPISKLADAINNLADALRTANASES